MCRLSLLVEIWSLLRSLGFYFLNNFSAPSSRYNLSCVCQVYRSVLISGRRRHHSGSNDAHKQGSPADGRQDPGVKRTTPITTLTCTQWTTINKTLPLPPQQVETSVLSPCAPAAPCPPPSRAAPPPPLPTPPARPRPRRLWLTVRRSSEGTWSSSTTAFTSNRCGTLRWDTQQRYASPFTCTNLSGGSDITLSRRSQLQEAAVTSQE